MNLTNLEQQSRGETESLLEALRSEIVGDFRSIDVCSEKTSFVIIAACKC
jgi:hypothetical protein